MYIGSELIKVSSSENALIRFVIVNGMYICSRWFSCVQ